MEDDSSKTDIILVIELDASGFVKLGIPIVVSTLDNNSSGVLL